MKSVWIVILVLALLCVGVYFLMRGDDTLVDEGETVYCTMDAMKCPDGSYVGRVPPSCNFEECQAPTSTPPVLDASINIDAN